MDLTKEIQSIELNMFKEIKKICIANNLKYYAIGGTCLGAVRHNGFIPWDDDMDLVMPVEDYLLFIKIAEKELKYPFALYSFKNEHWCGNYVKIIDERTTFVEFGCKDFIDRYEGVYIDIMPYYGSSKNVLIRHTEAILCGLFVSLNFYQRLPLSSFSRLKNKIIWILNSPMKAIAKKSFYLDIIKSYFEKKHSNISNMICFGFRKYHFIWSKSTYRNLFYYDDFSSSIELPFEDTTISIPVGYDRYLKMDFGDYMMFPPVEQRIASHPTDIIDLNKSYKIYIKEYFKE